MTNDTFYQIIAIAPAGDERATRRLQIALEEAFDLDLSTVMDALQTTGVCITSTQDPAEARRVGRTAAKLGADVLLLDEKERVLADSRKKNRLSPRTASHPEVEAKAGTELDLDDEAPPAEINMEVQPVPVPLAIPASEVAGDSNWMESKAASAVMEEVQPVVPEATPQSLDEMTPVPIPPPEPTSAATLQDPPMPPEDKASGSYNLDALSVDDLVSLDGGLTRSSRAGMGNQEALDFQNPFEVEEEDPLELDNVPLLPHAEDAFSANSGTPRHHHQLDEHSSGESPGAAAQKRSVTGPGLPAVSGKTKSGPSATERAAKAARSALANPMVQATGAAAQKAAHKAASAASNQASVVVDGASGVIEKLKDVFAERRRVRIMLGMVIALGLGGIFPAVHASSAFTTQFRPLLQELSNAEALAKRGDNLPEYRTPESVAKVLSGLKLRYLAFTATLWTALATLLAFIWFRIT